MDTSVACDGGSAGRFPRVEHDINWHLTGSAGYSPDFNIKEVKDLASASVQNGSFIKALQPELMEGAGKNGKDRF